ncbi:MAG: LysM peptidoglycan-binding domain-containing protein [Granulosicoccus sp.]
MIAVSDAVLILVSAAALGSGLYRWQNNVEHASMSSSRPSVSIEATEQDNGQQSMGTVTANTGSQGNLATSPSQPSNVVIVDPAPTASINVADDSETAASNQAVVDAQPYGRHTVRSGDSLSLIAQQYATTVRALLEVNELSTTVIRVGQELRYPLPDN